MSAVVEPRMPSARQVVALALPALGALAAEPLYVLGDTAIIGHLGTTQLAGLALAGLLLSELLGFCTFLEYGTTARAARLFGAGRRTEALDVGVQATWIALCLGIVLVAAIQLAAPSVLTLMAGGETAARDEALAWIRIAAFGAPFVLVTAAALGWLRAVQNTRATLIVLVTANLASIGLSFVLVYGAGMGIEGSAVANVVAQAASATWFVSLLVREQVALRPHRGRMRAQMQAARDLTLRTAAFFAAFTVATAVVARIGDPELAAHQIGMQLWILLALVLDATAIAAQALVGGLLGAGAIGVARALALRLVFAGAGLGLFFASLLALGHDAIPRLFTDDAEVLAACALLWPFLAGMMPLNGVLFALDGVLFGAGDLRFMRNVTIVAALLGFLPITVLTAATGGGLEWIWTGLCAFIVVRLVAGTVRWRGGAWAIGGTHLADEAA